MSDVAGLEAVAGQLRKTANKYNTTVSNLHQQTQTLDLQAQGLVTGAQQWAGKGSSAFLAAWSQYQQDAQRSASTLSAMKGTLNSLAQSIEENLPAIRHGQSTALLQQGLPPDDASSINDMVKQAREAAQQAEFALASMLQSLSEQLENLTPQVGSCSEPEEGPVDSGISKSDDGSGGEGGGDEGGEGDTGRTTPEGRPLSKHTDESLPRHGMTPTMVDDVIDEYSRKTTQGDGATVYIKKQPGRGAKYSIVVESTNGTIVTAMRDLSKSELEALGRNYGFNPNP